MTYESATAKFPEEIREFLDTMLAESGLPRSDPIVTMAVIQVQMLELIEKRRRKAIYTGAVAMIAICSMLSAATGYAFARAKQTIDMTHAIQITTLKEAKDAWVKQGKVYIELQ